MESSTSQRSQELQPAWRETVKDALKVGIVSWALAFVPAIGADSETYDLVISGGRVIDPDTGRDEVADVGLRDGSIAAVSSAPLEGARRLDARGMVVAPGFVDLHAHGQDGIAQRLQLLDGVTTALDMEAGTVPIASLYSRMDGRALINFGASASHFCARFEVMSDRRCNEPPALQNSDGGDRSPSSMFALIAADPHALVAPTDPDQERRIAQVLDREVFAGALGYGLAIEYVPGTGRREIFRIFQAAARTGAPVFTHVRSRALDAASGVPIAVVQEVIANAAATGASLQLVHLTSTGLGDVPTILELIKGARARGVDVTTEIYPYTAASTAIGAHFFSDGWQQRNGIGFGDLQWSATGERLTEATFNRFRIEQPSATVVIYMIPDEAVDQAIADPVVSIASDGMPWITGGEHPRGAGAFSRVLGTYVRDRQVLDLNAALAKMTIMPARRLENVSPQMARKGRLSPGADADVTVFDPAAIRDNATFAEPMLPSSGIRYVLVGGTLMVKDGRVTEGVFPGKAIRSEIRRE